MNTKTIQISTNEIDFFKSFYKEEPPSWINPIFISRNDWPPPKDWLNEPPHLEHKVKEKRDLIIHKKIVNASILKYNQVFIDKHGFLSNLSIVDLLFNLGPESLDYLKNLRI